MPIRIGAPTFSGNGGAARSGVASTPTYQAAGSNTPKISPAERREGMRTSAAILGTKCDPQSVGSRREHLWMQAAVPARPVVGVARDGLKLVEQQGVWVWSDCHTSTTKELSRCSRVSVGVASCG